MLALSLCSVALARGSEATERRTPVVVAVERVAPATVNITTEFRVSREANPFVRGDPFFEQFFEQFRTPEATDQTLGTGAIVDPDGYVLTNEHVLAGAEKIWITLADGREFPGELVGADPETDLAVLRIHSDTPLPTAPLADNQDLMIGETVIAIGNPFGLNHTVTTGVLSAVNRSFRADDSEYHGFLQTDASINPGNSGGPLLNLDGEVIGINTAIFREAEGIGFAIPIDRARRIMDDLISYGEVVPVWLGLRLQELTPQVRAARAGRAAGGALISQVFSDSPAERGGIQPGDILLAMEGSPVQSPRNYFEILRGITDGDAASLRLERAGEVRELAVRAEFLPAHRVDTLAELMLGFTVREMTPQQMNFFGSRGVVVDAVTPRSYAQFKGLRPGDVIWAINRDPIADQESYRRAIRKLRGRTRAILLVQRGRARGQLSMVVS